MSPKISATDEVELLRDHYDVCMAKVKEWGLTPFETDFHLVPPDKMYEMASYGMPGHFSHWTYGRDYWKQKTSYDYGMSKIYEMVINSNPAQAFLLENNSLLENMFVIAHVLGHVDFFANNVYFDHTTRHVEHMASALAERIRGYELEFGRDRVEVFIDDVMTIKEHIDPHLRTKKVTTEYNEVHAANPYEDLFPDLKEQRKEDEDNERENKRVKFPYQPERDLLHFIGTYGRRLAGWQRDIIFGLREEMIYLLPLYQTKIMNEGWASILHHKLMHEIDPEQDPAGIDFASMHSGTLSGRPGPLNPYYLGFNIYKRIIEVDGWERALEVRALDSDETFLRNYLDEKVCTDLNLFTFEHRKAGSKTWWEVTDKEWEKVRDDLVESKSNMGFPYITIEDADFNFGGQLRLVHQDSNKPLDAAYASATLKSVERLWGRSVQLETVVDGKPKKYVCSCGVVAVYDLE